MKKLLSLCALTALLITTGCGNKQKIKTNKVQEEAVLTVISEQEQPHKAHDKKEDYSIVA